MKIILNNGFNLLNILFFCILFLLSSEVKASYKNENLYDIIEKLFNKSPIKYIKNDSILFKQTDKSSSTFLYFGKTRLEIKKDSEENISNIKVNDITLDTVKFGNTDFWGTFEIMDIDPSDIDLIEIEGQKYFVISMNVKNCIGSFCRVSMNLLIKIEDKFLNGYFFSNSEIQRNNFFRISKDGKLLFLNVTNSFSNSKDFKEVQKYNNQKYLLYKITILEFNNEKWTPLIDKSGKEYSIIIKVKDQFNTKKLALIKLNWPLETGTFR